MNMILMMSKLYSYAVLTNVKFRKAVIAFLTCVLLALFIFGLVPHEGGESYVSLHTFRSGEGWGYEIRLDGKRMVYQPVIPAIDSISPFPTQKSAEQVGRLVLKRLREGKSYSLTREDVESVLIDHHPGDPGEDDHKDRMHFKL
jgi:hypothetical protein